MLYSALMRSPVIVICAIFVMLVAPLHAQRIETALKARLVHQPLYLRGQWGDDQLNFDSEGHLLGTSDGVPFTVSGVEIKSLALDGRGLMLEGKRMGLVFHKDAIIRRKLEDVRIQIEAPANGDYTTALDRIFTDTLADFVPALPSYWQVYGRSHFLPVSDTVANAKALEDEAKDLPPGTSDANGSTKPKAVGHNVVPPKVLFEKKPQLNQYAKKLRLSGQALVYLQVDTQGNPTHIRILQPVGAGLDEEAVKAVAQYKFQPAEDNGLPITIEMNIDIHFRIF